MHWAYYQFPGHTIRGSFGDFVESSDGKVEYFEPSVVSSADPVANNKQLALFAEYLPKDGGVLEDIVKFPEGVKAETTLVILKPLKNKVYSVMKYHRYVCKNWLVYCWIEALRMSIA